MKYLQIQFKKFKKLLPLIFFVNLLTIFSIFVLVVLIQRNMQGSEGDTTKIGVGIVGDIDSSYIEFGIGMLNTLDSSSVSVQFKSLQEEDATEALRQGEIIGYFRISKDFIEGLARGENRPIQFITSGRSDALMQALSKEVASTLSDLLIHSELAIYAMENYYIDHKELGDIQKANEELNKKLIFGVLERKNLYDVQIVHAHGEVSVAEYYIGALIIFFLLLSGLGMSAMFTQKDRDLLKLLYSRNIKSIQQIFSEYSMAILINLVGIAGIFVLLWGLQKISAGEAFLILEWTPSLLFSVILVVVMISSMQFLILECVDEIVPAMLLQCILGIGLAFASGIFYPITFFPKAMQDLAKLLPSYQGMLLLYRGMGYPVLPNMALICTVAILPILLAISVRFFRIQRS